MLSATWGREQAVASSICTKRVQKPLKPRYVRAHQPERAPSVSEEAFGEMPVFRVPETSCGMAFEKGGQEFVYFAMLQKENRCDMIAGHEHTRYCEYGNIHAYIWIKQMKYGGLLTE